MVDLTKTVERATMVRTDCEKDAERLDKTPFTAKGIGPVFGAMLAMIAALCKCVEELASAIEESR